MSRPRVFQVPPGLRVRGMIPGATQPAMPNYPVRVRTSFAGAQNNFPDPNGQPGSQTWPYTENLQFNPTDGAAAAAPLALPPAVGAPPIMPSAAAQRVISTPNGQSERDWINPTTYATIPLTAGQSANFPILQLNYKRNSLIIQNTSTATTAGDIAPTLYLGFNSAPQVLGSLALPPGLGFYWSASDCPPRDAVYVVFGPQVNTGGSVVVSGCVVQGTYVPGG